jgi:hypothetical protein
MTVDPAPASNGLPAREIPPTTFAGVADLQRRHGLPVTGRLDAFTERALRRELAWRELG